MKRLNLIFAMFIAIAFLTSCDKEDNNAKNLDRTFGIFKVLEDDETIQMDGVINRNSLTDFNKLEAAFPKVKTINIKNCDGSADDETNLQLSLKVHQKGIKIHLMDNGIIASGGVDFFIAGVERTKGKNTQIGVHSWSGENETATDFPVGHEYHLQYINYTLRLMRHRLILYIG